MKPNDNTRFSVGRVAEAPTCPLCESTSIDTSLHTDAFIYGSGDSAVTLCVELPARRCMDCETEFIDYVGERLRHAAVCRHLGVLTPAEVRGIREQYGMTRFAFAEATAIGEATLGRWETGAVIQNRAFDFYLRLTRMPFVMRILENLSSPRTAPSGTGDVACRFFRKLNVDKKLRKTQADFRLRLDGAKNLEVLAPAGVLGIRKQYGMTRTAFAEATAIGEATLGRWETGAVIQNRAYDSYLQLVRMPFVMRILPRLSTLGSKPSGDAGVAGRPFLRLLVGEKVRREQARFQLAA